MQRMVALQRRREDSASDATVAPRGVSACHPGLEQWLMAKTSLLKRLGAVAGAALLAASIGSGAAFAAATSSDTSSAMAKHEKSCEASATKKKLTGDAKTTYVEKCEKQASMKKKHPTATKTPAATPPATTMQPKG